MPGRKPGGPKTGGRKKGTPNKATAAQREAVAASGLTPLAYMLSVMRDEKNPRDVRLDAANKAAPYVHPRLAAVEHSGNPDRPLNVNVNDPRAALEHLLARQLAAAGGEGRTGKPH